MLIAFIVITLIVGVVCGVTLAQELRDVRNDQTQGLRPWLRLGGAALLVAGASALVERINETTPISGPTKTLGLLAGAVAFGLAIYAVNRRG